MFPTETGNAFPRQRSRQCTACDLHGGAKTVCMSPVDINTPGDQRLLVVLGTPTQEEDQQQQGASSVAARYVQRQLNQLWQGPIRYTYAISCVSGKKATDRHFDACLPHVWYDWDRFKPDKVLLLGYLPIKVVTGRYIDPNVRRTWAWVRDTLTFPMRDPEAGGRNIHHKRHFESDLKWALKQSMAKPQGEVRVLFEPGEVRAYLDSLVPGRLTIVDAEWDGDPWKNDFRLLCVGLCQDDERPVVIPAEAFEGIEDRFRDWMLDPQHPKGNQQINSDRQALYRHFGVDLRGVSADSYLWSRLYEPEAKAGLGAQAWLVGFGGYKEEAADAEDRSRSGANRYANLSPDDLHRYNGRDTSITRRLISRRAPTMKQLMGTYQRLVGPAFDALGKVERNGMLLSEDAVRAYDRWLEAKEEQCWDKLRATKEVPEGFNPGSSAQKAKLLYDDLKLPAPRDRNVQKGTLRGLAGLHPVVNTLIDLSAITKQRSTYGLSMLQNVSPLDGRVHTSFDLVRTGRLSSHNPNIQNITKPRNPGDEGSWARGCFIPRPGHKLVAVDYSQMELRVAAMLSGDKVMAQAFIDGIDFHSNTGAMAHGVPVDAVTKAQRQVGKTLNFAIVFGKNEYGIASELGISVEAARELMANLMGKYQDLADWRLNQIAMGKVDGEIWCVWDPPGSHLNWVHRRGVEDVVFMPTNTTKEAKRIRKHWENVCLNTPIQNVANAFSLASLTEAVRWTEEHCPEVQVVMTVHDEILLDAPKDLVPDVISNVSRIMLSWPSGVVPLEVEAEVGDDWGHMKKVPLARKTRPRG